MIIGAHSEYRDSLLELTVFPGMFLLLAFPGKVVVVLSTLHQGDKVMSTVVSEVEGNLGFCHLLCSDLHLWTNTERLTD